MDRQFSKEYIQERVNSYKGWYHKLDLGHGIVTPGLPFDGWWANSRRLLDKVDFKNKIVLDVGTFDGMWAFEAEKRGSRTVIATDSMFWHFERFLFCREVLNSKVIPYFNVSPCQLFDRLDVFFEEAYGAGKPYDRLFDIVIHFGVLYHMRDPLGALAQARSVVKPGGQILIETAVIDDRVNSALHFNGGARKRFYDDITTWWMPTYAGLKEMCEACLLEIQEDTIQLHDQLPNVKRIAFVAQPVVGRAMDPDYLREITRSYRVPGFRGFFAPQGVTGRIVEELADAERSRNKE